MGITRVRRVQAGKRKDLARAIGIMVAPPVIAGTLLFGGKRRRRR